MQWEGRPSGVPLMNVRDETELTELVPPGVGRARDVNEIKSKFVSPANNSAPALP
jgi:hypothetical protein